MKVLNITHKNCQDGFTAHAIVKMIYPECDVLQVFPGKDISVDDVVATGVDMDIILMTDISFSKECLTALAEKTKKLVVLDHHTTAKRLLQDEPWTNKPDNIEVIFDMNKCGAILTWEYLFPTKKHPLTSFDMPALAKYVDDRDRWQWKMPQSKEVNRGLFEKMDFSDTESLQKYFDWSQEQLIEEFAPIGKEIIDQENIIIQSLLENSYLVKYTYGNKTYEICMADDCPPHLRSEVGHHLAKKSKDFIGATWRNFDDGTTGVSARVFENRVDLTTIGFKGHPPAAGMGLSGGEEELRKVFPK